MTDVIINESPAIRQIPLTQGKFAIVDAADYEWLMQWKWRYHWAGYARRQGESRKQDILMHREILATPKGMDTDHINGNRLDCRRINLRICSRKENVRNQLPKAGFSSKYKGVSWSKAAKKWYASIKVDGRGRNLGLFSNEMDAANAYDAAAKKAFGEFAKINGGGHR